MKEQESKPIHPEPECTIAIPIGEDEVECAYSRSSDEEVFGDVVYTGSSQYVVEIISSDSVFKLIYSIGAGKDLMNMKIVLFLLLFYNPLVKIKRQ